MLFERFIVLFHFPLSLVNRDELGVVQVSIIAADQIQHAPTTVLVGKGLSAYVHPPLGRRAKKLYQDWISRKSSDYTA